MQGLTGAAFIAVVVFFVSTWGSTAVQSVNDLDSEKTSSQNSPNLLPSPPTQFMPVVVSCAEQQRLDRMVLFCLSHLHRPLRLDSGII